MSKYARFYAILNQINTNGLALTKEQAVSDYTKQRTESLSSLTPAELYGLEQSLSSMISSAKLKISANQLGNAAAAANPTTDKMRKAIISQFRAIGRTTGAAIAWAEKYGVNGQKRPFNDYTEQELYQLIKNAEKMKADFITAANKKKPC